MVWLLVETRWICACGKVYVCSRTSSVNYSKEAFPRILVCDHVHKLPACSSSFEGQMRGHFHKLDERKKNGGSLNSSFVTNQCNFGVIKITSRILLQHTLSVPEQDGGILWHPSAVIGMVPGWAKAYTCISLCRIGTPTPQNTPINDSKPGLQESFIECWIAKS